MKPAPGDWSRVLRLWACANVGPRNMAARLNKLHSDSVRAKIQASQLINRLTDHVNGKVELTATQVTAALGLLRKSVPDLSAVELSGEVEHTSYVAQLPSPANTVEEWQSQHAVQ